MTDWRRNTEMRQYQIRITKLAEEDLENAGDYIAHELKNPSAAGNTVSGIQIGRASCRERVWYLV